MLYSGRVYRIDNMENGNFYIGQTRNTLARRFTDHKSEAKRDEVNMVLYNAMRKYGPDMFTIEDIEVVESETKQELVELLNERERYYITTLKPSYNTAPGGLGHTGIQWTEERRIRFKELMSGENNPNFGKPLSEETKNKLRNVLKGRIIPDEVRQKTSQTMKGVPKSEETRKRMSQAQIGRIMPKGKDSKKAISISQYDTEGNFIKSFGSVTDAANEIGCQISGISFCLKGRIKTSSGFVWKYNQV
jgi:group I intron endonuclease